MKGGTNITKRACGGVGGNRRVKESPLRERGLSKSQNAEGGKRRDGDGKIPVAVKMERQGLENNASECAGTKKKK